MAITLFHRCQADSFDATHDFTAGDNSWASVGTSPQFSTSGAYLGTNGMFLDTSGERFELSAASIGNLTEGSALVAFRVSSWVDGLIFFRFIGTLTNDLIQLELGTTDELTFRHRVSGTGENNAISTDAANLAAGTFYIAIIRWDTTNDNMKLEVYNTSETLLDDASRLATSLGPQADLLTIACMTNSTPDVSIGVIIVSDDYDEITATMGNYTSYTQFSGGGATYKPRRLGLLGVG